MCGRYTVVSPASTFEAHFDAFFTESLAPRYNAAPSQRLPVITDAAPDHIQPFQWGLLPAWARDAKGGPKPINARAETLAEKPSFRQLLQRRRCLVLADSFYEWQPTPTGKIPHRILRPDEGPFAFAGLWDEWTDRTTGEVRPTFTIITTAANQLMAPLHERMPVILPTRAAERAWLARGDAALLRPLPDDWLRAYPVGPLVNSPVNNDPQVLEPAV